MRRLTFQFFQAMHKWSQRTASSDENIRLLVLLSLGPYDVDDDTESNLRTVEQRVEMLVEDIQLSEEFLIVALIREIEGMFEDQLAEAEKGEHSREVIRAREVTRRFVERATPQERHSASFQQTLRHYEEFERRIFPTPERVAQRRLYLETWHEVTRTIVESTLQEE